MSIYTKSGDQGKTSLLFGGEISKSDILCEAYGTIDQAVSVMGIAKASAKDKVVINLLSDIQKDLFIVAAELATDILKFRATILPRIKLIIFFIYSPMFN